MGITERAGIGLGIDLLYARGEDQRGAETFQQGTVGIERAGIVGQVVLVVKLGGVDKDAHHGASVLGHRAAHKRGMTLVKSPHRGHQPDGLARLTFVGQGLLEGFNSCYYSHLFLSV